MRRSFAGGVAAIPSGTYVPSAGDTTKTGNIQFAGLVKFAAGPLVDMRAMPAYATDKAVAFNQACVVGGAGARVIVPPGEHDMGGFLVEDIPGLTIEADGDATFKRIAGAVSPDSLHIGRFARCNDLEIRGITFDMNNIERFGGVYIDDSDRVWLDQNSLTDSNLNASWSSYDHYGFVFQDGSDLWVTYNVAEDVELIEADNAEIVRILDNTCKRAAGTAPIALAAVGNGYYFRDYIIARNTLVDPRKVGIFMSQEAGGPNDSEWRSIHVTDNKCFRRTIAGTGVFLSAGYGSGGTPTGNVWEDIQVLRNTVTIDGALTRPAVPEIVFRHSQAGSVFNRVKVDENTIHHDAAATGEWLMDLRKLGKSSVCRNRIFGGSLGMNVISPENTTIEDNEVEVTGTAYAVSTSLGGNRWRNKVRGAPTTPLSGSFHATDTVILEGNPGVTAPPLFVRKTADETVTASTTMQDDDHLTAAVAANATYVVELVAIYDGAATGDIKFQFAAPAGATLSGAQVGPQSGTAGVTATTVNVSATTGASGAIGAVGAGSKIGYRFDGLLRTAGTAGTFKLQWAQQTSDPVATTMFTDSYLVLRRVA